MNYIEGRCDDVRINPADTFVRAWEQTGLAPDSAPLWERPANRPAALTVRRRHYSLVVQCAFRDIERVVEHLHAHRLIDDASWAESAVLENHAVILPLALRDGRELRFFDAGMTRRVVISPWSLDRLPEDLSPADPLGLIGRIEQLARAARADLGWNSGQHGRNARESGVHSLREVSLLARPQ